MLAGVAGLFWLAVWGPKVLTGTAQIVALVASGLVGVLGACIQLYEEWF